MFERQRAKADERVRTALVARLRPGETIRTSVLAATRLRIVPLVVSLSLVSGAGRLAGLGDWSTLVTGAFLIAFVGLFVRNHYVVLTDQRLLVLRCRPLSSKVVSDEWEARRGPETPSYRAGVLGAFVTLDLERGPITLQVQWAFADRARALVKEAATVPAAR
jgi:hypothetical protein